MASTFSRSESASISRAIATPITPPRRVRSPTRSYLPPAVERRHSLIAAVNTLVAGCSALPGASRISSKLFAFQKRFSNASVCLPITFSRRARSMMIAHDQIDANRSPIITALTTISACMNSAHGDISAAPANATFATSVSIRLPVSRLYGQILEYPAPFPRLTLRPAVSPDECSCNKRIRDEFP